jgi:putative membrane protein
MVVLGAMVGILLSSVLSCVPGLHVYNVMGIGALCLHAADGKGAGVILPITIGMLVGYSFFSTIPSMLLCAPDESAFLAVQPGQRRLNEGRGYEGVMIVCVGAAGGLLLLMLFAPLIPTVVSVSGAVLRDHYHWIVWCVICFMVMSEWPRGGRVGETGVRQFLAAWRALAVGILVFLMSGCLGFILMYRSPVQAGAAFQNLMPAFVGLFTMPWLFVSLFSENKVPKQDITFEIDSGEAGRGLIAGCLGGAFAAFLPAVTGGVGAMLAGHGSAMRNERSFLVSQGASRLVYYVGAFMFFVAPGSQLTRGGAAWLVSGFHEPSTRGDYLDVVLSLAVAGSIACLLIGPMARLVLAIVAKCGSRRLGLASLVTVLILVLLLTGWPGLVVMTVASFIGVLPLLFGCRRMNCLGVILLPIACQMSGIGVDVARLLRL